MQFHPQHRFILLRLKLQPLLHRLQPVEIHIAEQALALRHLSRCGDRLGISSMSQGHKRAFRFDTQSLQARMTLPQVRLPRLDDKSMSMCSSLVSPAPLPSRICVSAALKFILSQRRNDGSGLLAVTRPSSASRSCFAASRYTASPCSRTPPPGTQSADFQLMKTPSSASRSPSLPAKNSPICRRAKKNPATTTTRAITTKPSKIHKPRRRRAGGRE